MDSKGWGKKKCQPGWWGTAGRGYYQAAFLASAVHLGRAGSRLSLI